MKTQLLEDIGQSATQALVPSEKKGTAFHPTAATHGDPRHSSANTARPRSISGVWRKKPADVQTASSVQPPSQQDITGEAPQPSLDPAPLQEAMPDPAPPVVEDALLRSEPALDDLPKRSESPIPDPLFDFAPRMETPASALRGDEPGWLQRSGQRYLLWGTCLLCAALAIKGAWWLHETRKDAGSLALVASELRSDSQQQKAAKRRALAAKEFTLGRDGEVKVAPAAPALDLTPPRSASAVPPLVLLEPEPTADGAGQAAPAPAVAGKETDEANIRPRADQARTPVPPRSRRLAREQPEPAVRTSRDRKANWRDRQLVRASGGQQARASAEGSATSETLKACKAYGYGAAQCIKRACGVTRYGFVCRGK